MWQIVNKLFTCVKSTLHFTRHIFDYQHPFHIMNYQDELDSSFATIQVERMMLLILHSNFITSSIATCEKADETVGDNEISAMSKRELYVYPLAATNQQQINFSPGVLAMSILTPPKVQN